MGVGGVREECSGAEKAWFNTKIKELQEIQQGWNGGKERKSARK